MGQWILMPYSILLTNAPTFPSFASWLLDSYVKISKFWYLPSKRWWKFIIWDVVALHMASESGALEDLAMAM